MIDRLCVLDILIASGWSETASSRIPADVMASAEAGLMPPRPTKPGARIVRRHVGRPRKPSSPRLPWDVLLGRKLRLKMRRVG